MLKLIKKLPAFLVCFVLLLSQASIPYGFADELKMTSMGDSNALKLINWKSTSFDIVESELNGVKTQKGRLVGTVSQPDYRVLISGPEASDNENQNGIVPNKDGDFEALVTIQYPVTYVDIKVIGPNGELENGKILLNWSKAKKSNLEARLQLSALFGTSKSTIDGINTSVGFNGTGYELMGRLRYSKGTSPIELETLAGVTWVMPVSSLSFPLFLKGGLRLGYKSEKLVPFLNISGDAFSSAAYLPRQTNGGDTYQVLNVKAFWAGLGTRLMFVNPKRWIEITPSFQYSPRASSTLGVSGTTASYTGWKASLEGYTSLGKSLYGGVDTSLVLLSGDQKVTNLFGSIVLGWKF